MEEVEEIIEEIKLSQYLDDESNLGYGNFVVGSTKCINVLLVGRSQTGKSTIVETLRNPQKGTSSTGFSDTKDPACNHLILADNSNKMTYQLNIIDTPGLKEVRQKERSRTDEELLRLASKCLEENITSLNVVCFVPRAGETHRLDTDVFSEIKGYLGDAYSKISMMVLTHCDEYSDKQLKQFELDIRTHEISRPYFEYCSLGIANFGAIDTKKLESHDEDIRKIIVPSKLKRIEIMRGNFLKKIISCADDVLNISQLEEISKESAKVRKKAIKDGIDKEKEKGNYCCIQ